MQKYFSANTSGAPPCERPCAPQRSSFAVRVALERDGRFWKTEGTRKRGEQAENQFSNANDRKQLLGNLSRKNVVPIRG
jgi:hypothetical protein